MNTHPSLNSNRHSSIDNPIWWQKKVKNGTVLDYFGSLLDKFGIVWAHFGIVWDYFGNTNTQKNSIFSAENAENTKFPCEISSITSSRL